MTHPFLKDDDSFRLADPSIDEGVTYFFGRRLNRQISSEMSETFFLTLKRLGISDKCDVGDLTDKDVEQLDAAVETMTQLMLDICKRKIG